MVMAFKQQKPAKSKNLLTRFDGRIRHVYVHTDSGQKEGFPWALAYAEVRGFSRSQRSNRLQAKIIDPHLGQNIVTEDKFKASLEMVTEFFVDQALFIARGHVFGSTVVHDYRDKDGKSYRASLRSTGKYEGREDIALVAIGLSTADFSVDIPKIGDGRLPALLRNTSLNEIMARIRRGETTVQETMVDIPDNRLLEVPGFNFWGSNWAALDPKTMIPHTVQIGETPGQLRRMCIKKNREYCGPVVLGVGSYGYGRREDTVSAVSGSGAFYGMVLEIVKTK